VSIVAVQKNPCIAFFLSLLIPGLGQTYNGEKTKGLIIAGAYVLLGSVGLVLSGLNRVTMLLALLLVWCSAILDAYKTAQAFGQPQDWYFRRAYVVAMLLLVGPLALPLLWRSPYFSRVARWGWTGVVTLAVLFFLTMPYLLARLVRRMPEFRQVLSAF
jgi:TM2 domain-containing membrane protein YozV